MMSRSQGPWASGYTLLPQVSEAGVRSSRVTGGCVYQVLTRSLHGVGIIDLKMHQSGRNDKMDNHLKGLIKVSLLERLLTC